MSEPSPQMMTGRACLGERSESMAADLPLVIDHFRYFAGVIRAEEGTATEIDVNTVSLCVQEPLGVVGQIIPWCARQLSVASLPSRPPARRAYARA